MTTPIPPHAGQPLLHRGRPLDEARAALILVHGRGASAQSILALADAFPHPAVAYLAPAASRGTWYPFGFMSPIVQNEPGISSGISVVHALLEEVARAGVPAERTVLLGFSQGACLVGTAAQRRPARYGGLAMLSGGLIGPPGTAWSAAGDFAGMPALLGCSDVDSHIPELRVRESAAHLERMGAQVSLRIYPGAGHHVNEDEMQWVRELLRALAG